MVLVLSVRVGMLLVGDVSDGTNNDNGDNGPVSLHGWRPHFVVYSGIVSFLHSFLVPLCWSESWHDHKPLLQSCRG